jgi:hypothetical protein
MAAQAFDLPTPQLAVTIRFGFSRGSSMFVVDHLAKFEACFPSPPAFTSGAKEKGKVPRLGSRA